METRRSLVWAEPRRSVLCTCGWGRVFPTLRAANAATESHLADGCEGCDHAVNIENLEGQAMKITETSRELFKQFAEDAGNWSGCPLVGGNVQSSKELRGNLTQLKRAGLVETQRDEGQTWLYFTDAGIAYAAELGLDLSWIRR